MAAINQKQLSQEDAAKAFAEEAAASIRFRENRKPDYKPKLYLIDHIRSVFGLEPARHHRVWIDALQDESEKRILIVCPPGHAKTTVAGVAYPSWRLANHIERHFIYFGNTGTQAEKQSVAIRDLMVSDQLREWYPHVERSKTKPWSGPMWYLERPTVWDKDPSMLALGVDGPALGARADEMLFDDVSDMDNTATSYQRKKVRDKVAAVAFSRQSGSSKNTRMVAVMTRWHTDDLANFFEKEGFKVIWMPAVGYWDYVHDYKGKISLSELHKLPFAKDLMNGGELWPEEYPREFFAPFIENSPWIWQLEYQGMPVSAGGNMFDEKCWRLWSEDKTEDTKAIDPYTIRAVIQWWDTASKTGSQHDYSVCETWAVGADGYYLLHTWRGKVQFPELVTQAKKLYEEPPGIWDAAQNRYVQIRPRAVYIEDSNNGVGTALLQALSETRMPCRPQGISGSKEERGEQAAYHLRELPFFIPLEQRKYEGFDRETFIDEHLSFPTGQHDDLVDVTSYAVNHLHHYKVDSSGNYDTFLARNRALRTTDAARLQVLMGNGRPRISRGTFGGQKVGRRNRFSGVGGDPSIPD